MATLTGDSVSRRDAFVARLFEATLGAWDLAAVYIGVRLGLYRVLAERGPLAPGELAAATATHDRYVREWLEQQAVTGILSVDAPDSPPDARRYSLPPGNDEALLDETSLSYVAPI